LYPSLSEPQIINTFKSDCSSGGGSAATGAGTQVLFEGRPAMRCLAISIHGSLEHQKAICGRNSTFLDENEKK